MVTMIDYFNSFEHCLSGAHSGLFHTPDVVKIKTFSQTLISQLKDLKDAIPPREFINKYQ